MVRGTQKQIIHLKNPESALFEEAFLIVKQPPRTPFRERTMVEEANRLLEGFPLSSDTQEAPKKTKRGVPFGFLLGIVCGAVLTSVLWLVLP